MALTYGLRAALARSSALSARTPMASRIVGAALRAAQPVRPLPPKR